MKLQDGGEHTFRVLHSYKVADSRRFWGRAAFVVVPKGGRDAGCVRETPNPPAEQRRPTGPNHWLSHLDTHQRPSTAPPSHTLYRWSSPPPPMSHRRHPSPILVNRLAAPPLNNTDQSSLTTGLYMPPHHWTLLFIIPFSMFYSYITPFRTWLFPLYVPSLAWDSHPFLFGSPARCVDYVVYYRIIY